MKKQKTNGRMKRKRNTNVRVINERELINRIKQFTSLTVTTSRRKKKQIYVRVKRKKIAIRSFYIFFLYVKVNKQQGLLQSLREMRIIEWDG